jgi:hypothetical protein
MISQADESSKKHPSQTARDKIGTSNKLMISIRTFASILAATLIRTPWIQPKLIRASVKLIGKKKSWIEALVARILLAYPSKPRQRELTKLISCDTRIAAVFLKGKLSIKHWSFGPPLFSPWPFAAELNLPRLATAADLAEWLGIELPHLEWFADCRGINGKSSNSKLMHYNYRILRKRFGSVRLIEAPKPRIKSLQRMILDGILSQVPTHSAAQGFRTGTSICTFASPHVNQRLILKLDLRDFFVTISYARVNAIFRALGYSEQVAELLAGICTNSVPEDAWAGCDHTHDSSSSIELLRQAVRRYHRRHLPQGAPTSPALANLSAYRLDCRLSTLAETSGAKYTRYADDLAFSGPDEFRRSSKRFYLLASAICLDEGFQVNFRKTRIMPRSVQQRLAGVVVNSHPNAPRRDFDLLKAILTNCARLGPESQNRAAHPDFRVHLLGRISFITMIAPARGQKLRAIYDRIVW